MSDSQTELFNQALSQAGITRRIALPSEASIEAETCTLYYDLVRTNVLSAAHWASCRGAFRLNRLAEKDDTSNWTIGDPQPGWRFAHGLPNDYVRAWYINNMEIFQLSTYVDDAQGRTPCVVSNQEQVVLTYTHDETNIQNWEVSLYTAIMLGLSGMISYALTRKLNKSAQLVQQANEQIKTARQQITNAEEYQQERLAPWLAARPYTVYNVAQEQNYIHPYGPLLTLQGLITDDSAT